MKRELDKVTRILCDVLGQLAESGRIGAVQLSDEAQAWLAEHRAYDERQGRRPRSARDGGG